MNNRAVEIKKKNYKVLQSVHPLALCSKGTFPHFSAKSSSSPIRQDTWGKVWLLVMTRSRCEPLWEERWRPRSSFSSIRAVTDLNALLKTLGSEPCQWQAKRRRDITDLMPQAIYEKNPSRPWVWVSLLNESSKGFFIKTSPCGSANLPIRSRSDFKRLLHWHHAREKKKTQRTTTNTIQLRGD